MYGAIVVTLSEVCTVCQSW